ncbi:MAG TPA: tyrosine-type recombinase/integrase [Oculatellaceae cyanobacterium]
MPKINAKFMESGISFPTAGQLIIRDDSLKGFGLRATPNCISFIVEKRVDGKTRRITLGRTCEMSVDEARKRAVEYLTLNLQSKIDDSAARRVNLREVFDVFLEFRKLRPSTVYNYSKLLNRCLGDWLDLPIADITRDMVQQRHKDLTRQTRQGSSGKTQANITMRILNSLLIFAARHFELSDGSPIILSNPVARLSHNRQWHPETNREVIIVESQLAAWYSAVMGLRQKAIRDYLVFLCLTGLRRMEAATLRWSDIDFRTGVIRIRSEVAKNQKGYALPMSEFLFKLLSLRFVSARDSEFVFPSRMGGGHMKSPQHAVSVIVKRSGCQFVVHDLRRTFISMAARLGVPQNIIKKLVNHSSKGDVTERYIVLEPEVLRAPMERITERFLYFFGYDPKDWELPNPTILDKKRMIRRRRFDPAAPQQMKLF